MPESASPLLITPPPVGWSARPLAGREADRLARRAMIVGILSFFVNPLLLSSIIGIVYGRRSLRQGTSQRSMAIAGIVTGSVSGVLAVVSLAVILPLSFFLRGVADTEMQHSLERSITAMSLQQGAPLTDVACPTPHSPGAGSLLTCTAESTTAGPVDVQITYLSATSFRAQLVPAG